MTRSRDLIILLALIAVLVAYLQPHPTPPTPPTAAVDEERAWLPWLATGVMREAQRPLVEAARAKPRVEAPTARPSTAPQPEQPTPLRREAPKVRPSPSGLYQGERTYTPRFTIRGIGLDYSLAEIQAGHGRGELVDYVERYSGLQSGGDQRLAHWAVRYGDYSAACDRFERAGQIWGNGLERNGIAILAADDTPADVEELLGQPDTIDLSHYGNSTQWHYKYPGFTLVIDFGRPSHGETIRSFKLEANDFAVPCC